MPWLDVYWPGCRTSRAIDIWTLDRHPLASVGMLGLRCSRCPGSAPYARGRRVACAAAGGERPCVRLLRSTCRAGHEARRPLMTQSGDSMPPVAALQKAHSTWVLGAPDKTGFAEITPHARRNSSIAVSRSLTTLARGGPEQFHVMTVVPVDIRPERYLPTPLPRPTTIFGSSILSRGARCSCQQMSHTAGTNLLCDLVRNGLTLRQAIWSASNLTASSQGWTWSLQIRHLCE